MRAHERKRAQTNEQRAHERKRTCYYMGMRVRLVPNLQLKEMGHFDLVAAVERGGGGGGRGRSGNGGGGCGCGGWRLLKQCLTLDNSETKKKEGKKKKKEDKISLAIFHAPRGSYLH